MIDMIMKLHNYNEAYDEFDINIPEYELIFSENENGNIVIDTVYFDQYYHFEGYQVYQLANSTVSVEDIDDPDKARLVGQFDKKNDVSTLINYTKNEEFGFFEPEVMVEGGNDGISHSFQSPKMLLQLVIPNL